jgi:hypothetical protein
MELPRDIFSLSLSSAEFRVLVCLTSLGDDKGLVDISTERLGEMTGYSTESLRRAFRGLEKLGVLNTRRTKRNWGRFHLNKYQVFPSHNPVDLDNLPIKGNVTWEELPSHNTVGSTSDSNNEVTTDVVGNKNTTYSYVRTASNENGVSVVIKNYDDGDDIGGVGLFEDEVKKTAAKNPVSKRDTKTRGRRPEAEWTAYDVGAEFAYQLSLRFPLVPGLVNASKVSGAIRKYRSSYGTNGQIEMELMRKFFADDRNYNDAETAYAHLAGRYLATFKTSLSQVRAELATPTIDTESSFLYASDGRKFDDTILGRRRMNQHEESLREDK